MLRICCHARCRLTAHYSATALIFFLSAQFKLDRLSAEIGYIEIKTLLGAPLLSLNDSAAAGVSADIMGVRFEFDEDGSLKAAESSEEQTRAWEEWVA